VIRLIGRRSSSCYFAWEEQFLSDPSLNALRGQIVEIVAGTAFLLAGGMAFAIAAIRRRSGVRVFLWLGTWSGIYGFVHLTQSPLFVSITPPWFRTVLPYVSTTFVYLIVVAGALSFLELSTGKLRRLIGILTFVALIIAVIGVALFVITGLANRMILYNNLVAACVLFALATAVAVPQFSRKYLMLSNRGVFALGAFAFATEALYSNVANPLGHAAPVFFDHLGFAVLLTSFAYVALQNVFVQERRLLSVENELAIATEIQASILPASLPLIEKLRLSAAYRPMTAVAGDFYEFIPVDEKRLGILVADVSGHGVPAALIASMIKVAVQSVTYCAHDPSAVLCGLNRSLAGQLRGQFVSAAYLWLDMDAMTASYSAAGHPPLLLWRHDGLQRIESNGLLFGILPEEKNYPMFSMNLEAGDRFLLYTDGVIEPENSNGDAFGESKLEQVIRENQTRPAADLSQKLLEAIREWQPTSTAQQDDLTLVIADIL
jgi:phosphoserine phosphatase RsbU/P